MIVRYVCAPSCVSCQAYALCAPVKIVFGLKTQCAVEMEGDQELLPNAVNVYFKESFIKLPRIFNFPFVEQH